MVTSCFSCENINSKLKFSVTGGRDPYLQVHNNERILLDLMNHLKSIDSEDGIAIFIKSLLSPVKKRLLEKNNDSYSIFGL